MTPSQISATMVVGERHVVTHLKQKEIKMINQEMINMRVVSVREQIQNDLLTLLDDKFGPYEDIAEEVKNAACQIVVDRFAQLLPLLQSDVQVRVVCNNSLTDSESKLLRIRHHKELPFNDNSLFSKKTKHKEE